MQKLFTYGSLQKPEIQNKLFGRLLTGTPDTLAGYGVFIVEIEGKKYNNISPKVEEKVDGFVYELSDTEIERADRYEGRSYKRAVVKLQSGVESFVYIRS